MGWFSANFRLISSASEDGRDNKILTNKDVPVSMECACFIFSASIKNSFHIWCPYCDRWRILRNIRSIKMGDLRRHCTWLGNSRFFNHRHRRNDSGMSRYSWRIHRSNLRRTQTKTTLHHSR